MALCAACHHDDRLFWTQVVDQKYYQRLLDIYQQLSPEKFKEYVIELRQQHKPWSLIKNKYMLSGNHPCMLSENQIILYLESGHYYAFDFGDIDHLLDFKKNPFTKNKLDQKFRSRLEILKSDDRYAIRPMPLDKVLLGLSGDPNAWCPDRYITSTHKTSIVFYESRSPVDLWSMEEIEIDTNYNKHPWTDKYIYRIDLDKKIPPGESQISIDEVKEITLVHNPSLKQAPFAPKTYYIDDKSITDAIHNYHNGAHKDYRNIPANIQKKLRKLPVRENHPVKLYRGLFDANLIIDPKKQVGDIVELDSTRVQSWTHNLCVAEKYASFVDNTGVVVSAIINPQDIIIDSRFIDDVQLQEHSKKWHLDPNTVLFIPFQNEVLTVAKKFTVKIESWLYDPEGIGRSVDFDRGREKSKYRADMQTLKMV